MRVARALFAIGAVLVSAASFAHAIIDPVAGAFDVAGNGGLAWFAQYIFLTII